MSMRRGMVAGLVALLAGSLATPLVRAADTGKEYRNLDVPIERYAVSSHKSRLVRIVTPVGCGDSWLSMHLEGKKRIVLRVREHDLYKDNGAYATCGSVLVMRCSTVKLIKPIGSRKVFQDNGTAVEAVPHVAKPPHAVSGEPPDLAHPSGGACPLMPTSQPQPAD